jgi:hypothetical protein
VRLRSKIKTSRPCCFIVRAKLKPAMPAPITSMSTFSVFMFYLFVVNSCGLHLIAARCGHSRTQLTMTGNSSSLLRCSKRKPARKSSRSNELWLALFELYAPKRARTAVWALRGPRPGPLDDGGLMSGRDFIRPTLNSQSAPQPILRLRLSIWRKASFKNCRNVLKIKKRRQHVPDFRAGSEIRR